MLLKYPLICHGLWTLASLYSLIHIVMSEITLSFTYQKALHSTLLNNEVGGGAAIWDTEETRHRGETVER